MQSSRISLSLCLLELSIFVGDATATAAAPAGVIGSPATGCARSLAGYLFAIKVNGRKINPHYRRRNG